MQPLFTEILKIGWTEDKTKMVFYGRMWLADECDALLLQKKCKEHFFHPPASVTIKKEHPCDTPFFMVEVAGKRVGNS